MRLTLRTLLAYLDDTLEPAEAREIGQKIASSQEATKLVDQVRESLRRRRIAAPELSGPGSGPDPNIVAEYLESALPPNQVIEYEQLCRRSDLHLAEVAACHKILTMVMSQPIEVSDELRERMYTLGSNRSARDAEAFATAPPPMTVGMSNHGVDDNGSGLPEYLTRGRTSNRLWTALVVMLIAGVWIALVVSDRSIWSTDDSLNLAVSEPAFTIDQDKTSDGANGPITPQAAAVQKTFRSNSEQASPAGDVAVTAKPQSPDANAVRINPLPPPDSNVNPDAIPQPMVQTPQLPNSSVPPSVGERANAETPGDTAATTTPATEKTEVAAVVSDAGLPQAPPPDTVAKESPLTVLPPQGINVHLPRGADRWTTAQSGQVQPGDKFAAPSPFTAELNFQNDLIIELLADSRIERVARQPDVDVEIELERGRLLIRRPPTSLHAVSLAVTVLGQRWTAVFDHPDAELALEIVLPQPMGSPDQDQGQGQLTAAGGGLGVVAGSVRLTGPDEETLELTSESGWHVWPSSQMAGRNASSLTLPEWTRPDDLLITPARRQMALAFENEFDVDVVRSVGPVVNDRQSLISNFAALTMIVTENYLEVVPALESEHEDTRLTVIRGLREWMGQDRQHVEEIRAEFERRARPELVEQVIDLLWGFSRESLQSPQVSAEIVELLSDDELVVRELAHFHLMTWTGRSFGYHAQASGLERRAAIGRWQDFLEREGSLIQPTLDPSESE